MVFAYYSKLSRTDKAIYRRSDSIESVKIPIPVELKNKVIELDSALGEENRLACEKVASYILNYLAEQLQVPALQVRVLASRPSNETEELHGLYEPEEGHKCARISVWMRTARKKKIVAFRSFLRTLLHEFCHHLDYEYFLLRESFHTEGFFKRESDLLKQLLGEN